MRLTTRLTGWMALGVWAFVSAQIALPATFTVTSTLDDGSAGTLRWAILQANGAGGTDIIDLTGVSGTITLTSELPTIFEDVTVDGGSSTSVTISGAGLYRIVTINTQGAVLIHNLIFTQGVARGGNGGTSGINGGGGGGGAGVGGAIFVNSGDVSIRDCSFTNCVANGGAGGVFNSGLGANGGGGGGGIGGVGGNSNGTTGGAGGSPLPLGGPAGSSGGGTGGPGGGGGGGGTDGIGGTGGWGGGGSINGGADALGGMFGGNGGPLGNGKGGGGGGLGGAIFVRAGIFTLRDCSFAVDDAVGGLADPGAHAGLGKGGAVFIDSGAIAFSSGLSFSTNLATSQAGTATDNHDVFGVLSTGPRVTSITRVGSTPTNLSSVSFTVTFSAAVTGVDTSDFSLTTTGISGASINSVSGSGTTYSVRVDTGSGDGTIRLDLHDDNTILVGGLVPLGGVSAGDGDFTGGESFTFDRTSPVVDHLTVQNTHVVDVIFTEAGGTVTGAAMAANYSLSGSGRGSLSLHPDSATLVSGLTYRLAWNSGEMFIGGDVTITVAGVSDALGNPIGSPDHATSIGGGVGSSPTVTSVTVHEGTTVDVTFNEPMGAGVITAGNYTLSGTGRGSLAIHPDNVALVTGNIYRLTWTSGEMFVGGNITITVVNLIDPAGNPLGSPSSGTAVNAAIGNLPSVIDVVSQSGNPVNGTQVVFNVQFGETITGFESGDVIVNESGVTHAGVALASVSGSLYTLTITGLSGTGTLSLSIPAGAVNDLAGNASSAFGPSVQVTVQPTSHATAPSLSIVIEPQSSSSQTGSDVFFDVHITNSGDGDATGVSLTIPLPDNADFVSADLTQGDAASSNLQAGVADDSLSILLDLIPAGSETIVRVKLHTTSSGEITLNAQLTSDQTPTPIDAPQSDPVEVTDQPVVKPVRPLCGAPGLPVLLGAFALVWLTGRSRR